MGMMKKLSMSISEEDMGITGEDIATFARNVMGIDLFPGQVDIIQAILNGKLIKARQMGFYTSRIVAERILEARAS